MIAVRKAAGLTNQSEILNKGVAGSGYVLHVKGTNGNVLLLLGSPTAETYGYKLATEGTNYQLYVSDGVDLSKVEAVDKESDSFVAPEFCQVNDGEICAFFEAPTSWTTVKCWAWDDKGNYTGGTWPGAACSKVGTNNGKDVWKWTWDKSYTGSTASSPKQIIFNNDNKGGQTSDLDFKNGGYYNQAGALQGVVTGIQEVSVGTEQSTKVYTLDGRLVRTDGNLNGLPKGVYIVGNKKFVLK